MQSKLIPYQLNEARACSGRVNLLLMCWLSDQCMDFKLLQMWGFCELSHLRLTSGPVWSAESLDLDRAGKRRRFRMTVTFRADDQKDHGGWENTFVECRAMW
jgi:hypothetical protein